MRKLEEGGRIGNITLSDLVSFLSEASEERRQ